ncbi:hypothetical protein [Liquorilactobacillus aquaticus]|uniref:3-dehydroquinate synthase family protein n=1 Tax=Liquorilactobacillus aquaticus TaxID=392566 RepID=UPI0009F85445
MIEQAESLIRASIAFKAGVVLRDEKEKGVLKLLNFGHTLVYVKKSSNRFFYTLKIAEIRERLDPVLDF